MTSIDSPKVQQARDDSNSLTADFFGNIIDAIHRTKANNVLNTNIRSPNGRYSRKWSTLSPENLKNHSATKLINIVKLSLSSYDTRKYCSKRHYLSSLINLSTVRVIVDTPAKNCLLWMLLVNFIRKFRISSDLSSCIRMTLTID